MVITGISGVGWSQHNNNGCRWCFFFIPYHTSRRPAKLDVHAIFFLPHSFWLHLYCPHSHNFYYSLIVYNIFFTALFLVAPLLSALPSFYYSLIVYNIFYRTLFGCTSIVRTPMIFTILIVYNIFLPHSFGCTSIACSPMIFTMDSLIRQKTNVRNNSWHSDVNRPTATRTRTKKGFRWASSKTHKLINSGGVSFRVRLFACQPRILLSTRPHLADWTAS